MSRALALDIGGTKLAAAIVDLPGPELSHRQTRPTPAAEGGAAVLAAVTSLARDVLAAAEADDVVVETVGVASAGTVSPIDGSIVHATDTLPGWADTPLAAHLSAALDLPVTVLNDVHAHGVGEAVFGQGVGHRTVLAVAVGTGVGGGLVIDGEPVVGGHGVAGHVGHLPVPEAGRMPCTCGRVGHLEGFASGVGLRAAFRERTGQDLPALEIAALVAGGRSGAAAERGRDGELTAAARTLLSEAGRATGRVIGALLNVLDPDIVVVGGGLAQAPEPWPEALAGGVRMEAMDAVAATPVVLSGAGAETALWGAAHVALARRAGNLPDGIHPNDRTESPPEEPA